MYDDPHIFGDLQVFQKCFWYAPESVAIDNFPQKNNEGSEWFKEATSERQFPKAGTVNK